MDEWPTLPDWAKWQTATKITTAPPLPRIIAYGDTPGDSDLEREIWAQTQPEQVSLISWKQQVASSLSRMDILQKLREILGKPGLVRPGCYDNSYLWAEKVLIDYQSESYGLDPFTPKSRIVNLHITAWEPYAQGIRDSIESLSSPHCRVNWWYMGEHGTESSDILVEGLGQFHPEFYPWIPGGVEDYLDRYLASDEAILLMLGPPGTGKTTLLRHLITSRKLEVSITYEDKVLERDDIFMDFMQGSGDLLIIEDADTMLGSRTHAGNKLMARFLSISDGLIKFPGKKIIFTTNLESTANVDPALVREGRCFDILQFRGLVGGEIERAAEAAGLTLENPKARMTTAEIFNPDRKAFQAGRVGF